MYAVLCNEDGKTLLGSDGYLRIDGRLNTENQIQVARDYQNRFQKHFQHKCDFWTHVMFVSSIRTLPTTYNRRSTPKRHKLSN